ncbi:hypothetical protein [Butyrivibrio proteoclasticus]|uniref:hypothetical protein n=1 Tax=Butyrivibrio proteoclasticus TaxID=43305 RepID=UPI00047964B3|nr:hypothetical protein [Butyrivibrio proteoclasticus]
MVPGLLKYIIWGIITLIILILSIKMAYHCKKRNYSALLIIVACIGAFSLGGFIATTVSGVIHYRTVTEYINSHKSADGEALESDQEEDVVLSDGTSELKELESGAAASNSEEDQTDESATATSDVFAAAEETEDQSGIVDTISSGTNGYVFPTMSGNTYTSSVLGIKYTKGSDWKFADEQGLASHDGVTSDNFFENLYTDIMNNNSYRSEMFAESNDGYKTVGVSVVYYGKDTGLSEKLDKMVAESGFEDESLVAQKYGGTKAETSIETTTFKGNEARKVTLKVDYENGAVLYSDVYIFGHNGFIGILTINSVNEDTSSMYSAFN